MTDIRTTELRVKRLRELLDERGIEHYDHENGEPLRVLEKAEEPATSWRVDGASYCAVPDGKGTFDVWIDHCTPEQAISATLGSEREKALEELESKLEAEAQHAREGWELAMANENRIAELIRCLENDWNIRASWDGLRKFWCIELTEEGVKLRDSLNEVADKWASEKIKAEDYARENMMLKANNGSRWHELFGTPERAARTLDALCGEIESCDHCEMKRTIGGCGSYDALLEWLKGEAE